MEEQKLRSRDDCEKQLAVELSIGAVESIDDLIDKGHEVACEYACQLLFENIRMKVANIEKLPDRIVQHLLKDPCGKVRVAIINSNWESLTPEQQEEVIVEAEQLNASEPLKDLRYSSDHYAERNLLKLLIKRLLRAALQERKEPEALRYIELHGLQDSLPLVSGDNLITVLKDMPKVCEVYWERTPSHRRKQSTILAHLDEKTRMAEVMTILDKKTCVSDLHMWKKDIGKANSGENLKGKILQLWANDPSENIRRIIAKTTTNVQVLEMLVSDSSDSIRRIAYPRYKKFQKRTEYSKEYQKRKAEKAEKEYQQRVLDRYKDR